MRLSEEQKDKRALKNTPLENSRVCMGSTEGKNLPSQRKEGIIRMVEGKSNSRHFTNPGKGNIQRGKGGEEK